MRKTLSTFLLAWLLCPVLLWAAGSEQTLNTVPTNNSSFLTNLQTFLKREDAQRYELQFEGFVLSGGTHGTVGSLTAAPTALVAFPGGHYTTEVGSITYANNETTWVIAHKDLTGNLNNFARVAGTHYLIDSTSASKPSLPADSVWLMEVTTSGGAVTAVVDLRSRVPYMGTFLLAELPAAGQRGRLAFVRDAGSGTAYLDTGTSWISILSSNVMTASADMIVGGVSGAPTRLPKGTANQVLGMNSGATAQEYKSITAGSGIGVAHSAGDITISLTGVSPSGVIQPYMGTSAPSGWLLCDGATYDADTYPDLFAVYVTSADGWGLGTAVGTFTVNTGNDTLTSTGHGLSNGNLVHVANSGGTLPTGLSANTKYYVISATTDTLQLSLTLGGSAIDITAAGSGTHSLYNNFKVPDMRARVPVGTGANTQDWTISAVDTGTERITVPSNSALYTGDIVLYDTTAGAIGGLTDSTNYYIIRISATQVQLATTEANAVALTAINLTSSGSGTQVLRQTFTTRTVGVVGGTENIAGGTHKHGVTDPGHTHLERTVSGAASQTGPADNTGTTITTSQTATASSTTGLTITNDATLGGGANMTPFLAVNYIVKT